MYPTIQTFPPGRQERMERTRVPAPPTVEGKGEGKKVSKAKKRRGKEGRTLNNMVHSPSARDLPRRLLPLLDLAIVDSLDLLLSEFLLNPLQLFIRGRGDDHLTAGRQGELGGVDGDAAGSEDEDGLACLKDVAGVAEEAVPGGDTLYRVRASQRVWWEERKTRNSANMAGFLKKKEGRENGKWERWHRSALVGRMERTVMTDAQA
jgi:hypothetical protein